MNTKIGLQLLLCDWRFVVAEIDTSFRWSLLKEVLGIPSSKSMISTAGNDIHVELQ